MSFDASALASAEALRLVSFTSSDAFEIGIKLRQLISSQYAGKPAIIDIRAAAEDQQVCLPLPFLTAVTRCTLPELQLMSSLPTPPPFLSLFGNPQYFFAVCAEGSQPDNRYWAERKRRSVVRFGKSTASLRMKWPQGIPTHFAASEDDVRSVLPPELALPFLSAWVWADWETRSTRSTEAGSRSASRGSNPLSGPSSCQVSSRRKTTKSSSMS